jgi:protocatechuate 3,4-dioxygenase beta subunit
MLRLAALLVLAAGAQAATVTGTVFLRSGDSRQPFEASRVIARAAEGNEIIQTTTTDVDGRYIFRFLPNKKISLSVSRPGFTSLAVAGGEAFLLLDLAADEDIGNANFDLLPGGAITGRITDSSGDPLEDIRVVAWRVMHFGGNHRVTGPSAQTDDRGIYRIFGLEAGQYVLLAHAVDRSMQSKITPAYYPGTWQESRAREIDVAPGAEVSGIDMAMGSDPGYSISGQIAGPDREQMKQIAIVAAPIERIPGFISRQTRPDESGNFRLNELPAGVYEVTAFVRGGPPFNTAYARLRVDLRGDRSGITIRQGASGRITGQVIVPQVAGRSKPETISVAIADKAGLRPRNIQATAHAPDYKFEIPDLPAGTYVLRISAPFPGAYLKKRGAAVLETPEINLSDSGATTLQLEIASGLATLSGMVKDPRSGAPVAEARVGLAEIPADLNSAGALIPSSAISSSAIPSSVNSSSEAVSSMQFRTAKADQRGRWELRDLPPGEYWIGAWPALRQEALYAPETWERAGASVRRLRIDPDAQTDIEITGAIEAGGESAAVRR